MYIRANNVFPQEPSQPKSTLRGPVPLGPRTAEGTCPHMNLAPTRLGYNC